MFGKTDKVFDLLQQSSEATLEVAREVDLLARRDGADKTSIMATFTAARRREKDIAAQISEELVNTFVTALDREDIEAMNSALYKIPKTVEKFAERYVLVAQRLEDVDFSQRTGILVNCAEVVAEMVMELRKGLRIEPMRQLRRRLQALEGEADKLLLEPYRGYYLQTDDPMQAILTKDLYEIIEKAIDTCRDVGNTIYSIILKNS